MKKFFLMIALLAGSLILNIYMLQKSPHPLIVDGVGFETVADWSYGSLSFAGTPISLEDPKSNLKNGYQFFSVAVRLGLAEPICQVTNILVNGLAVTPDRPFQTSDRPCRVLKYDAVHQSAIIEGSGITFTIQGEKVAWQDKSGNGSMFAVRDYLSKSGL